MTVYEFWALAASGLSLLVAGIALGWNIFRDVIDRPKLALNLFVADVWDNNMKNKQPKVVSVAVTNVGKRPIVIHGFCFVLHNGNKLAFQNVEDMWSSKKLEPYDRFSSTLPNAALQSLIERSGDLRSFVVYDTSGRKWKLPRKTFNEFKQQLQNNKTDAPKV
jgi:hypothetical protein